MNAQDFDYEHDLEIYAYYIGEEYVEIGLGICSILPAKIRNPNNPERGVDRSPSFWLYESERYNKDCLKWYDAGAQLGGDSLKLIEYMEGINFYEAMQFYKEKIKPSTGSLALGRNTIKKPKNNYELILNNYYNEGELNYWKSRYDIGEKELIAENIYSLRALYWTPGFISDSSTDMDPVFTYIYPQEAWKIYAPLRKNINIANLKEAPRGYKRKWISKGISGVEYPDGYHLLPLHKVDTIYICSSKKDSMVMKKLGHYSLAQISESSIKRFVKKWDEIKLRARNFIVIPDGDNAGTKVADTFNKKLNIPRKNIIYPKGTKDPSDIVEQYGYHTLGKLLK